MIRLDEDRDFMKEFEDIMACKGYENDIVLTEEDREYIQILVDEENVSFEPANEELKAILKDALAVDTLVRARKKGIYFGSGHSFCTYCSYHDHKEVLLKKSEDGTKYECNTCGASWYLV